MNERVLHCVAVCCSVLQYIHIIHVNWCVLQCAALVAVCCGCCSVLQLLQCVAGTIHKYNVYVYMSNVFVCVKCVYMCQYMCKQTRDYWRTYGVATISRRLKIIGLFCKRSL